MSNIGYGVMNVEVVVSLSSIFERSSLFDIQRSVEKWTTKLMFRTL